MLITKNRSTFKKIEKVYSVIIIDRILVVSFPRPHKQIKENFLQNTKSADMIENEYVIFGFILGSFISKKIKFAFVGV